MTAQAPDHSARRSADALERKRAGWISLVVAVAVLAGKLAVYYLTGSVAVYADALESLVNVAAAILLVTSLRIAAQPADRGHRYGHGKVEYFSAGIEGGLIVVAASLIAFEAVADLVRGASVNPSFDGLLLLAVVSGLNAWLSYYLIGVGRRTNSPALVADGMHVRTDVVTSAAVIFGLLAVRVTGWEVLDPLIALAAAANILREGWGLLQNATSGLMNAAPEQRVEPLIAALEAERPPSWIDVHDLRAFESGATLHLDLHLTVPRYISIEEAHDEHENVVARLRHDGDTVDALVHFDPCEPRHCSRCEMPECSLREAPSRGRQALTLDRVFDGPDPETETR